jgi:hypothetical protein
LRVGQFAACSGAAVASPTPITDIAASLTNVRFTPESGHRRVPSSLNNKSIVERDAELLLGPKAMQQNCCIAASFLLPKI